jgi:hypothetical protein
MVFLWYFYFYTPINCQAPNFFSWISQWSHKCHPHYASSSINLIHICSPVKQNHYSRARKYRMSPCACDKSPAMFMKNQCQWHKWTHICEWTERAMSKVRNQLLTTLGTSLQHFIYKMKITLFPFKYYCMRKNKSENVLKIHFLISDI